MNRSMSQKPDARFTEKQGHYLAFIYTIRTCSDGHPPNPASPEASKSSRRQKTCRS